MAVGYVLKSTAIAYALTHTATWKKAIDTFIKAYSLDAVAGEDSYDDLNEIGDKLKRGEL